LYLAIGLGGLVLAGCGGEPSSGDRIAGGRAVYLSQCTACHASDPALPGPVGPPLRGASRELLEAKVLHGTYPAGYTPKRPTAVMTPLPQLASSIDDLAAFLR
jgi:mono/diheme cytochrome c family protein